MGTEYEPKNEEEDEDDDERDCHRAPRDRKM